MTKRIIDGMSADQILTGWTSDHNRSYGGLYSYLNSICKPAPIWEDDASADNPVLCWVAHSLEDLEKRSEIRLIHKSASQGRRIYKCNIGNIYSHATPITPDECWKPTKQGE